MLCFLIQSSAEKLGEFILKRRYFQKKTRQVVIIFGLFYQIFLNNIRGIQLELIQLSSQSEVSKIQKNSHQKYDFDEIFLKHVTFSDRSYTQNLNLETNLSLIFRCMYT